MNSESLLQIESLPWQNLAFREIRRICSS